MNKIKPIEWVATAKKDLRAMPDEVQADFGYALYLAQIGEKSDYAKPLQGFGSAGVLEIVENFDRATYRAIYTVQFEDAIYVLHCFQKKSKRGSETPKHEIDLIRERLKEAQRMARESSSDRI